MHKMYHQPIKEMVQMDLNVVMQRIAELWTIQLGRGLTDDEYMDFVHSMNANAKYWWKRAYLSNQLVMATIISDVDYQNEVLVEISRYDYGVTKEKSRGKKPPTK